MKKKVKQIDNQIETNEYIDTDSVDSLFPFVIEEKRDRIEAGGNFIRVLAFAMYPDEAKGNWLSDLKRIKGNISITQHIEPASSEIMIDYYNNLIKNKSAELDTCYDPKRTIELKKEIKAATEELNQAYDKKSGFVYLYTYVMIQSDSEESLNDLEEKVMMILRKLHIKGIVPYKKMRDAYFSAMPIDDNVLKEYTQQMANTTSASSFFLFDDNEICDLTPGATIEGINKTTNSLIAINYNDKKKTLNRNKFIIGTSGIGKSTYMKHLLQDMMAQMNTVFILDPEGEYSELVERYGGTVIKYSVSSDTKINPLQYFNYSITDNDNVAVMDEETLIDRLNKQKTQRLKGLWKLMKADMSDVEQGILDGIMMKLYDRLKTKKISDIKNEDFPILEDVYLTIEKMKETDKDTFSIMRDFYYVLQSYVYGANSFFNGYTNVELKTRTICYDLSALQEEKTVQGACYYNLFQYLWDELTKSYKAAEENGDTEYCGYLIADEFHFLLTNPESCDFFFQAYKRFRKYKSGCIVATQQIVDILNQKFENNIGTAITENSHTKIFFGLDNKGVKDVINKLDMKFSKNEIALLKNKVQGEALVIYGNKRVFMRVELPQEELRVLNKSEYAKKYSLDPNEQPNYKEKLYISPVETEEILNMGGGR